MRSKKMKPCVMCGVLKHESEGFTIVRGSQPVAYHDECKPCRTHLLEQKKKEAKAEALRERARLETSRLRECAQCGATKSFRNFFTTGGGLLSKNCKECDKKKARQKVRPPSGSSTRYEPAPWVYNGKVYEGELIDAT